MSDFSRDPNFLLKEREPLRIAGELFGKELEGYFLIEHEVADPEDLTHAAFSEAVDDAVAARDDVPGLERSIRT